MASDDQSGPRYAHRAREAIVRRPVGHGAGAWRDRRVGYDHRHEPDDHPAGLLEIRRVDPEVTDRVRRPGGGRKRLDKESPGLIPALRAAVADDTAGDPITGLRRTHKAIRRLARPLNRLGLSISRTTVARSLRADACSLRTDRKRLARTHEPERDRPLRLIARRRARFLSRDLPVLSVDTKKKEWVGNFKNAGTCWRKESRAVLDHDSPSWAIGRAIPFGIDDEGRDEGFVAVGTSHETPEFAIEALRTWWREVGSWRYPTARRWLIEADCGGAHSDRTWAWKVGLQRLADEFGVTITVSHYPSGASKGDRIEHRLFNLISANWAGEPLVSYEAVLKHIRATTSPSGFACRAVLDERDYPTKKKFTAEQKAAVRLRPYKVLPRGNDIILPRRK